MLEYSCVALLVTLLSVTESFSASRTSVSRSLGRALDTLSLCRQDMAVDPNLALRVLQAMRNGEMK